MAEAAAAIHYACCCASAALRKTVKAGTVLGDEYQLVYAEPNKLTIAEVNERERRAAAPRRLRLSPPARLPPARARRLRLSPPARLPPARARRRPSA